jgi:hypothetical protein
MAADPASWGGVGRIDCAHERDLTEVDGQWVHREGLIGRDADARAPGRECSVGLRVECAQSLHGFCCRPAMPRCGKLRIEAPERLVAPGPLGVRLAEHPPGTDKRNARALRLSKTSPGQPRMALAQRDSAQIMPGSTMRRRVMAWAQARIVPTKVAAFRQEKPQVESQRDGGSVILANHGEVVPTSDWRDLAEDRRYHGRRWMTPPS